MPEEPHNTAVVTSRLDDFLDAAGPLTTIDCVGQRVLSLLAKDLCLTDTLKNIVKSDPAMTVAVLSTATKTSAGSAGIEHLWQTLPPGQIISSVLTTAVGSIAIGSELRQARPVDRTGLWRHSVAVALISRATAEQLGDGEEDDEGAYLAGLLHDLGKLILSGSMPKGLGRCWQLARNSDCDILEAERQVFEFDHTELGKRLAQRLSLPAELSKCIWLHHLSHQLLSEQCVRPVIFADTLARELSLGQSGNLNFPVNATQMAEQMGLSQDFLTDLQQRIPEELDDAGQLLGLDEPFSPVDYAQNLAKVVSNIGELQTQSAKTREELAEAEDLCRRFAEITRRAGQMFDRKALDAELAQVASGAAHELNNPLTVISGRSQILANQETDPDKKKALELIDKQAREASAIASELMAAVDPPEPKLEATAVVPIIRKLCAALAGKAQATNSEVIFDLPEDLPEAFIDPDMFEKSLLEILKNALASLGQEPGSIRVDCRLDQLQEKLVLEVADSGIGMDARMARNAFVPFFSSMPAGRSRGLGLTLAKTFIEANQGRLWLRSRPGEGTTVWLSLPLAKEG